MTQNKDNDIREARERYFSGMTPAYFYITSEINARTSNPLRPEWGIKYPPQDRKTCDIIFVANRQLEALSLRESRRGIVFRPFFMGSESFSMRQ